MIDLKVFIFLAILGLTLGKMIEMECLTVVYMSIWKNKPNQPTKQTHKNKNQPTNKQTNPQNNRAPSTLYD